MVIFNVFLNVMCGVYCVFCVFIEFFFICVI